MDIDSQGGASAKHTAGSTVKDRLAAEKRNTKPAASESIKAKMNREMPTHQDMVDCIDEFTKGLACNKAHTDRLMDLAHDLLNNSHREVLQATNRTNTPPSSPSTKRTKMRREIRDSEEIVVLLTKKREQMQAGNESKGEMEKVTAHINQYQKAVVNLEAALFAEM